MLAFVGLLLAIAAANAQQETADFLLIPDLNNGNIVRINVADGTSSVLVTGQPRPVAIAYDQFDDLMFWSDIASNSLRRANGDGTNETILYRGPPASVSDGMTLSNIDKVVYYSDTGVNVVACINYDGLGQRNLITTDVQEPRAIALDHASRTMFFTDWGYTPGRIWSASMDDGSNRVLIVNSAIQWPNGLTADETTRELFWCDSGLGNVETSDYTGQNRRILVDTTGNRFFGIGVDSQWLYLSSWSVATINKYPRTGGNTPTQVSTRAFSQAGGIAVSYVVASALNNDARFPQ